MSALDKDFTRRLAFLLAETFLRRRRLARFFRGIPMDEEKWARVVKSASDDIRNLLRYASDRQYAIDCLRAAVIHYRGEGRAK